MRATCPILRIIGGVAMVASNSSQPSLRIWLMTSSVPMISAPACQSCFFVLLIDKGQNANALASAVRQHHRRANLLVAVAGINAEPEMRFDGLIELGLGIVLDQLERLVHGIIFLAVKGL